MALEDHKGWIPGGWTMKIVRYQADAQARYGVVEGDRLYPCSGDPFSGLTKQGKPLEQCSVTLLSPLTPSNILCVGLNYRNHAEEGGYAYPEKPLLFMKPTTAVCGPGDPIVLPSHNPDRIDYEVELALVIGKVAKYVPEARVHEVILGVTVANDVSNRAAQRFDGQWIRAKSYDTFCPLGPAIVTDLDRDRLQISCRLDGKTMQSSNTSDMIFSTRQLVSYLSECMTLLPGTVILTGTPEGVGFARKPPVFLAEGQTVECEIEGIGVLSNPVVRQK
jgi:2-keto-4-pentenoate hydratase/2-oxohepta-3-ene-1,7-dioic acid hydratase in catechol pathway